MRRRRWRLSTHEDRGQASIARIGDSPTGAPVRIGTPDTLMCELGRICQSATIDFNFKAYVQVEMCSLLDRCDYPQDHEEKAIKLVLQQAELFANREAALS